MLIRAEINANSAFELVETVEFIRGLSSVCASQSVIRKISCNSLQNENVILNEQWFSMF